MSTTSPPLPRLADITRAQVQDAQSLDFVKYLSMLTVTRGAPHAAAELFLTRFPNSLHSSLVRKALDSHDLAALETKAAILPGTSTDATWAGSLVGISNLAAGFLAIAHSQSLLGRLPGLQQVPFNTKVPFETTPANYAWVSESGLKPVSRLSFSNGLTLTSTKAMGIIVLSAEFMKVTGPGTAATLRSTMISGLNAFLDDAFLNPTSAPVPGQKPGSITNGTVPITGTGNLAADVKTLIASFFAGRPGATEPVLLANGGNSAAIKGMVPGFGLPVIPTAAAGVNVVMVDPSAIYYADGGIVVDYSSEAALEMDSAPVGTAAAVVTSLWQSNLVGWKVERYLNFAAAPNAVKYLTTP